MKLILAVVLLMAIQDIGSGNTRDSASFLIAEGKINELVFMGENIDSALNILSRTYKVIKSGIPDGEGFNARYPVYSIQDDRGTLCTLERGWSANNSTRIVRFTTSRHEFVTLKGIRPGMTYGDLKDNYKINNINYSGGQVVYVIVSGFDGAFSIEIPDNIILETKDFAMRIPYEAVIREIILILNE